MLHRESKHLGSGILLVKEMDVAEKDALSIGAFLIFRSSLLRLIPQLRLMESLVAELLYRDLVGPQSSPCIS